VLTDSAQEPNRMTSEDSPRDGIGRRVKAARKLAGITQQQLATTAHVSLSLVKQVEQAKVREILRTGCWATRRTARANRT
jgi:DNA-binding XRE family transcriptional regulator